MVLEHLALAFQSTCRLLQMSILKYLIPGDDRISTLPDDILYSIISLLTVRDLLNASMISRRWRYLCVSIPNLNFDFHTVFGATSARQVCNDERTLALYCINHCPKYTGEFMKILNQFRKIYMGPKISYFRVSFCLESECFHSIDQWVSLAVSKGVEKLELSFVCNEDTFRMDKYKKLYTLSLQLLSEASKLKHLRLYACALKPDLTNRFNSLANLYLFSISLSQIELPMILRNCLNLEWLAVKYCILPAKLCISDLSSLKYFALTYCKGLQNLELSVTNLTTFEISNKAVIEISFSCVPKMENVFFSLFYHSAMPYIFGEVAKVLPQLKTLSITTSIEWVENIPASPSAFGNVKRLELFMFQDHKYDLVKIIAPLLSALPILQKLYVAMPFPIFFERRVEEEAPLYPHTQLKEIEIGGFRPVWNHIDFAIYMLKNAVALKHLIIDTYFKMYIGSGSWRKAYATLWSEEELKCIRDLLMDNILSSKTQLIIRNRE